jgi:hypothetical protein
MKRSIFFAIVVLWLASYSSAQQDKTLNIAIIADKAGSLAQSPLIALLETKLSQNNDIHLLERAQIDKIMQEQQLTAAGFFDRNNTIKIGQLLRADALVIITLENEVKAITTGSTTRAAPVTTEAGGMDESASTTENKATGDLIRVRVAEAAHGLRLLDRFEQLDSSKLNEIAERINKNIKKAVDKLSLPTGQLIPVGIVDIHRVQLGERYTMLERTLPKLLSVRLGLEPKIVMLEREDLKVLLDEKLRTQGEDTKFWASAVLIEGNLQPKNGGLEMQLTLARPAGKDTKIIAVPVEPNEPSVAVDKAATNIVQEILNAPPSTQWQLVAEAEQFYQQGQMLVNHSRYEESIPLFETAHAIQPQNVYYTGAVFERVWDLRQTIERVEKDNERWRNSISNAKNVRTVESLAKHIVEPSVCPYTDLEIAEMVSVLVRQIRDGCEKGLFSASEISNRWLTTLGYERGLSSGYFVNNLSRSTDQIRLINRENRKIWVNIFDTELQRQLMRNNYPISIGILRLDAQLAWISSDDPNEIVNNVKKAFNEYVMPPELGGRLGSASQRKEIYQQAFGNLTFFSTEELKNLADVNDYLVSTESKLALLRISLALSNQSEQTQSKSKQYEIIVNLVNELKNFDASKGEQNKQYLLTRIKNFLSAGGSPLVSSPINEIVELWETMCTWLIEQNDITSLAFLDPGWRPFSIRPNIPPQNQNGQLYLRYFLLLDRITEILQNYKDDKQVIAALNNIKDFQTEIINQYPQLSVVQKTLNLSIKMLLTPKDGLQQIRFARYNGINTVIVQDKMLWIIFKGDRNNNNKVHVSLAGIDLERKVTTALWESEVPCSIPFPKLDGLSINKSISYLYINAVGIIEFPGSLKEGHEFFNNPKVLTQENGLPSLLITAIAKDSDKLWVAYGDTGQESGLGIYDPITEKWETIFCSTLKGESAFSKGNPYVIHSMQMISPEEMFFLVYGPSIPINDTNQNVSGLWKMNIKTHETKYFGPLYIDSADRINVEYKNQQLFFNSWYYIIRLDTESDRFIRIAGDSSFPKQLYSMKKMSLQLEQELFHPDLFLNNVKFGSYYSLGNLDLSTSVIHNNKLWARQGTSQIIIAEKGKSYEEAQIIDNNILDGEPVCRFVSTPYGLIAIGEGTVGLIESQN